jgi:hypothetical protein
LQINIEQKRGENMKAKYKGHEYEITWNDPAQGWEKGHGMGLFRVNVAVASVEYQPTFEEAETIAKQKIDEFINAVPQTKAEWVAAFENAIVWDGYEDCHLDKDMVWALLLKASKHLK